ncbi:restriction endonuclease [Butyrivibrio sp. AC2005]|uniref:restriction endonuclease n=1 Tax=Butyrivibrio sp. AC2005 TaxID=1280672 RepID=UPI0006775E4E|nr:restriction endonuclease [Butyrivibrio sp. AC2005]
MKYFEYRRYKFKLKIYKFLAIVIIAGLLFLYLRLRQMGVTNKQLTYFIYVSCIALILVCAVIKLAARVIKKRKYLNSPLAEVDKMSGKSFEYYLKCHFENLGYRVKLTPDSGDFGADLVCRNSNETLIIQAKRYRGKVGIAAIQEIVGAKGYYKADRCMVITNSYFTNAATELAKSNDVELWDRNNINQKLIKHSKTSEKENRVAI